MLLAPSVSSLFKWPQFEPEVILLAVGWYRRFSLSYLDVEQLLAERDLLVGPSPSGGGFNAPELNRRVRKGQSKETVALGRIEVVFYAMTQKICTYCDEPVTTVGHVPPKCFFSNPLPSELITVLARIKCSEQWAQLDGKSRNYLGIALGRSSLSAASMRNTSIRSVRCDQRFGSD